MIVSLNIMFLLEKKLEKFDFVIHEENLIGRNKSNIEFITLLWKKHHNLIWKG